MELLMNTPSGSVNDSNAFVANDDMEQVRQLLIGDHAAQQNKTVSALEQRIMVLEQLVHALIVHGNANNRAWQEDVAALLEATATNSTSRTISHDVTPLTPPHGIDEPHPDD
jgi:sensor domain CHASE-containing protein